jgi:hypothetical protein
MPHEFASPSLQESVCTASHECTGLLSMAGPAIQVRTRLTEDAEGCTGTEGSTMMSAWALKRWLMREVCEVGIGRKPPGKAVSSLGRAPARNLRYRTWIRSLPCAGCGQTPAGQAAHTGSDRGMGQKPSDYSCIPLCSDCHIGGPDAYHRWGKMEFEKRFNLNCARLVRRLNRIWWKAIHQEWNGS